MTMAMWLVLRDKVDNQPPGGGSCLSTMAGGSGVFTTKAYWRHMVSTHLTLTWNNAVQHVEAEKQHQ